jgi:hypothetical protein
MPEKILPEEQSISIGPSRVLLVVGMHRSGTSLTASWLEKCGLYLGDELISSDFSNPMGHYEDIQFSHFQRRILRDSGLNLSWQATNEPVIVSNERRQEARTLIATRQSYSQWGWKDPRTALLLDFWKDLLPEMKILAVYRPCHQVVDSLLRRASRQAVEAVKSRRGIRTVGRWKQQIRYSFLNIRLLLNYLRVWCRYNRDILSFVAQYPDDALVIHIKDLLPCSLPLVSTINRRWGFTLEAVDAATVYEESLLTNSAMIAKQAISSWLCQESRTIYRQLEEVRQRTLEQLID